jgi:hypothetical protein
MQLKKGNNLAIRPRKQLVKLPQQVSVCATPILLNNASPRLRLALRPLDLRVRPKMVLQRIGKIRQLHQALCMRDRKKSRTHWA